MSSTGASYEIGIWRSFCVLLLRLAKANCIARSLSDALVFEKTATSSSSPSLYSTLRSLDADLDRDVDLERLLTKLRPKEPFSLSELEPPGDFPLLSVFLSGEREKKELSSSPDTVVAAVAVELERCENFMRLPSPVVVVCVYIDERLAVDFVRRWLLTDPPKKSPMAPGRVLKRFREIASRPKMDTLERAVGVDGREFRPVRNSNKPN